MPFQCCRPNISFRKITSSKTCEIQTNPARSLQPYFFAFQTKLHLIFGIEQTRNNTRCVEDKIPVCITVMCVFAQYSRENCTKWVMTGWTHRCWIILRRVSKYAKNTFLTNWFACVRSECEPILFIFLLCGSTIDLQSAVLLIIMEKRSTIRRIVRAYSLICCFLLIFGWETICELHRYIWHTGDVT